MRELRAERPAADDYVEVDTSDFEDRHEVAMQCQHCGWGLRDPIQDRGVCDVCIRNSGKVRPPPPPEDRPTSPEPLPACRVHVENPAANYTFEPLDLGSELERILIIPDTHSPFHDPLAWKTLLDFGRKWRPHTLIHLGDLADFYSVSDHDKDPRRANNLLDECNVTNALLDELDDLGAVRRIFCEGNHEYRLERYLMRHAPALLGIASVDHLLRLQERGWSRIPYAMHGRVGKLYVTHEAGKSGQNAVQQMAQAVGGSIAFGHTHRLQIQYFGSILGDRHVSATCGWLGDKASATYKSEIEKAPWQLGFATAIMERSGCFELQARPIVDYRVLST